MSCRMSGTNSFSLNSIKIYLLSSSDTNFTTSLSKLNAVDVSSTKLVLLSKVFARLWCFCNSLATRRKFFQIGCKLIFAQSPSCLILLIWSACLSYIVETTVFTSPTKASVTLYFSKFLQYFNWSFFNPIIKYRDKVMKPPEMIIETLDIFLLLNLRAKSFVDFYSSRRASYPKYYLNSDGSLKL